MCLIKPLFAEAMRPAVATQQGEVSGLKSDTCRLCKYAELGGLDSGVGCSVCGCVEVEGEQSEFEVLALVRCRSLRDLPPMRFESRLLLPVVAYRVFNWWGTRMCATRTLAQAPKSSGLGVWASSLESPRGQATYRGSTEAHRNRYPVYFRRTIR